jgi:hypothetical protein
MVMATKKQIELKLSRLEAEVMRLTDRIERLERPRISVTSHSAYDLDLGGGHNGDI